MNFTADELEALAADMDEAAALFLKLVPRLRAAAKALRRQKPSAPAAKPTRARKAVKAKPAKKAAVKRALRKVAKKARKVAEGAGAARKRKAATR